jgi:hypothetical protein
MTCKSLLFAAASVALATAMVSCGGGETTTPTTETPAAPAAGGKTVDAATAGTVKGTIKLDGAAPRMRPINMAAEPTCARQHTTPVTTQNVVTGATGELQNVVVYLQGDFAGYSFDAPAAASLDQHGCLYTPHVLALRAGQQLNILNSDMTTHNIHPVPKDNREWNESQPPGAGALMQSFARPEIGIPVKCNVHPWMQAYISVFNHPYFQVTGADGTFELKNIPPGTYTLTAWHETFGAMDQMVTVAASEQKTVDVAFKPTAGAD